MKTFMSEPKGPHQLDMKTYAIANPGRRRP
jgi:hypothetical protein